MVPIPTARRWFLALSAILAIALVASPASATIYKWIDAQGNVGFTDDPSSIPPAYRDAATQMSETELERRVPIQREVPGGTGEIRIPGNAQTIPRPSVPSFQAPAALEWGNRTDRKAYVPDLGYLIAEPNHGPSEHTGTERIVYVNGERFILENPHPVESDVNWADKRTFGHVYGPEVRFPELDVYPGGQP